MIDWFVLLAPIPLLPIVLLFACVGCTLERTGLGPQVVYHVIFTPSAVGSVAPIFNILIDVRDERGELILAYSINETRAPDRRPADPAQPVEYDFEGDLGRDTHRASCSVFDSREPTALISSAGSCTLRGDSAPELWFRQHAVRPREFLCEVTSRA